MTGHGSTYPWPIPGAKRTRTIREAEDRARMPILGWHDGSPVLCVFRMIALPAAISGRIETPPVDLFSFYFREAAEMVAEVGCTLHNHVGHGEGSAIRHFDIPLLDYMIVAKGDPKSYVPLRNRLSDYIRDFTPVFGLRDQRVPKMARIGVDQRGRYIVAHHQRDHVDLWNRFWPHRRPLNPDLYSFIRLPPDANPVSEPISVFAGLAKEPFAVYVNHSAQVMFLLTRSEEDLVFARLSGVI